MESNDISTFVPLRQVCLFEGVLAHSPETGLNAIRSMAARSRENWRKYIEMYIPYERPLKSLIDSVNRRNIGVEVVTLLGPDAAEEIDHWLYRRGVAVPVIGHNNIRQLAESIKFHHPSMVIHLATEEQAAIVGIRSRVAAPTREAML